MTEELKPCPFCGNDEEEELQILVNEINWYYMACGACLAEGPHCKTINDAIIEWNTRHGEKDD